MDAAVKGKDIPEDIPDEGKGTKSKEKRKRKSSPKSTEEGDVSPSHKVLKLEKDVTTDCDQETEEGNTAQSQKQTLKRKFSGDVEDEDTIQTKLSRADSSEANEKRKKPSRKRLKYLTQAVLDQMEFYFSDSNLSKDRYLKKLIEQSSDGYVDLSVFGQFNKLQTLHKDGVSLKLLGKALEQSEVLQLSGDKTRVKRTTPFREISAEETNDRTVYVEYLPSHATHAWIQTTFAACGKVMYVSLPKYQSTGHIKGFAFVEFQSAEEAKKACDMLNNPPPAKEGDKPGRFPKGNKTLNRLQKIVPPKLEQDSNEENVSDDTKDEQVKKRKKKKAKRRKKTDAAGSDGEGVPVVTRPVDGVDGKKKKKKKKRRKVAPSQDDSGAEEKGSADDAPQEVRQTNVSQTVTQGDGSLSKMEEEENGPRRKKKKKKKKKGGKKPNEGEAKQTTEEAKQTTEEAKQTTEEAKQTTEEATIVENEPEKGKEEATSEKSDHEPLLTPDQSVSSLPTDSVGASEDSSKQVLGRRERKKLRQEDIKRKKLEREAREKALQKSDQTGDENSAVKSSKDLGDTSGGSNKSQVPREMTGSDAEDGAGSKRKSDGSELTSILKSNRQSILKKVEFNPVAVTQEFVREKEIRKRKKAKKDKLHLRVISKKEWLSLKAEYLKQQKSHMAALKESLRELRQQESQNATVSKPGSKHVDLEDVFGTKRLKPTQDVKMAHVEALQFTPNVIVQWKSSNEMHRDKIRTMFKDISGDSIAYIDAQEEAKSGYIRFKDEASAEQFAKLSRHSNSFSARVLPEAQQQTYWDKANEDRLKKLGRKKQEKGSQKIARKVFERNKVTFHEKPSRICFNDSDDEKESKDEEKQSEEEAKKATETETTEEKKSPVEEAS